MQFLGQYILYGKLYLSLPLEHFFRHNRHVIPASSMVFLLGLNSFTDGLIWYPGLSHIDKQYYELQINGRLNFPCSCNSFHIQNTGMVLNLFQHYAFSFYAFGLVTWLFLYAFLEYAVSTRKVEMMWIDTVHEDTEYGWFCHELVYDGQTRFGH